MPVPPPPSPSRPLRFPRLSIAHQLSLLIAAAVALAVLSVGALTVWNLNSGFRDYLQSRDEEQLIRLTRLVEQRAAADPSMDWLRGNREAMRALMDEFNGTQARGRPPGQPPRYNESGRPPPRPDRPGRPPPDDHQPPGPPPETGAPQPPRDQPPPRSAPPGNLGQRVMITDMQGVRLAGREAPPGVRRTVRAVKANGVEVARIELGAEPEPEGVDARFLQRQYTGLALAALGTLALAVLAAWLVARRWSRPLQALQLASRDIAAGKRPQPLQPTGALEIAQLMQGINSMAAELARLEAARRLWIAQISHELRTPLAVLRGEIESIEDGARQPTREVMASLRDEVLQLNRLVNDLHTLSMADVDGLRCEFTRGDANAALVRVAQRFWDFGRIEQLLGNLITNSLRYTDAPGEVHVNWKIDSSKTNAGLPQQLVLSVEDSAPGVSPTDLPQLFEPLFRADKARQRGTRYGDEHGSGLGLAIVRSIAQAHGGTVVASPSPRGGLLQCVYLPLQAGANTT
jgi:two-component system, OmpR family, sensor histidine kinase BaeS